MRDTEKGIVHGNGRRQKKQDREHERAEEQPRRVVAARVHTTPQNVAFAASKQSPQGGQQRTARNRTGQAKKVKDDSQKEKATNRCIEIEGAVVIERRLIFFPIGALKKYTNVLKILTASQQHLHQVSIFI